MTLWQKIERESRPAIQEPIFEIDRHSDREGAPISRWSPLHHRDRAVFGKIARFIGQAGAAPNSSLHSMDRQRGCRMPSAVMVDLKSNVRHKRSLLMVHIDQYGQLHAPF